MRLRLTNGAITYVVSLVRAGFKYLDRRLTAEAIGNDIIYIKEGKAETIVDFYWAKMITEEMEARSAWPIPLPSQNCSIWIKDVYRFCEYPHIQ